MEEIRFDTIQQVNDFHGFPTFHPLVTVLHLGYSEEKVISDYQMHYGVLRFGLKKQRVLICLMDELLTILMCRR